MSGVGYPRVTHPFAARHRPGVATGRSSLDLHALGTPPAFILSQDQTLHLRSETPAGPEARGGVLEGARWPWSHTSLTIRPGRTGGMGGAGAYPCTARGSSVIRMRQGTVPRGQAPKGRGFGTGFSHTVEFSRNVAGLLFGDSPAVPASRRRRSGGTVPRAFQARQRLPTCPVSVLLVEHHPPRRHLHTEAPPCARTFWASGRPPNSRRIDSYWRSATSCLPMPTPWASSRRGPRSRRTSLLAAW